MSPLRFRAWHKPVPLVENDLEDWEQPKMYYDVQKLYDGGIDGLGWVSSFGSILDNDEFIVMQSTGLRDKNGKEIFEGDVVRRFLTDRTIQGAHVQFFSGGFWCNGERMDGTYVYEIIGNIHEHPALVPAA